SIPPRWRGTYAPGRLRSTHLLVPGPSPCGGGVRRALLRRATVIHDDSGRVAVGDDRVVRVVEADREHPVDRDRAALEDEIVRPVGSWRARARAAGQEPRPRPRRGGSCGPL